MKRFKHISKKAALLFLAVLLPASSVWQSIPVFASDDSLWINNGELSFEVEGEASNDYIFGVACNRTDITVSYKISEGLTDKTVPDQCLIPLELGTVTDGGYYFSKFAKKAGRFRQGKSRLIPVPESDAGFWQRYQPDIYSTRYIEKLPHAHFVQSYYGYVGEGSFSYSFQSGERHRVTWDDGRDMVTMTNQLAVSANGKWMIVRHSGGGIVRINLETLEVLTAFDTGGGWPNPRGNFEFAISNDGRYGIVSGGVFSGGGNVRLIDFARCEADVEQTGEVTPGCGVRDITDYIEQISGGERRIYKPSFTADSTQIQMNLAMNGEDKRIALVAPGEKYSGLDYLAMGDSFASGEGDHDDSYYEEGTNVPVSEELPEGEKCHISRRSYPYLLAQTLNIPDDRFESVACSGAKIEDIHNNFRSYEGQQNRLNNLGDSEIINMKDEAIKNFIPGRATQIEFVEKYKPKIVTISIGGNDVGFADVVKECVLAISECDYASKEDSSKRFSKAWQVRQLTDELADLYTEIHKASVNTKIYVLGYSKLMKKDGQCSPFFGFNDNEREFMDESFSYVNDVIEAAAKRAGVTYLDVENALGEAMHCGSEDPNAANGVVLGDDLALQDGSFRIIGNETYHPNQYGHAKISRRIAHKVNDINCQPGSFICPQEVDVPTIPDYFKTPASSITQPDRTIALAEKQYMVGSQASIVQDNVYAYDSSVGAELHSEPRHLGTFQTDENGSLNASFTILEDVPAGYHTLKLKGTLISGEEVEFTQTILVLGREGDRDNNGVPDKEQECIEAPIAVTSTEGKVLVPPCAELDTNFMEVSPQPDDDQQHERPSLEESIAAARQAIRQFLEQSEYYRRLPFAEQQNLIALLERHAISRIANVMTYCDQNPESTVLNFNFLKIVLGCHKTEDGIQLSMSMYLGLFKVLFSSMTVKEE